MYGGKFFCILGDHEVYCEPLFPYEGYYKREVAEMVVKYQVVIGHKLSDYKLKKIERGRGKHGGYI